ncbi:hypothetical protein Ddc_13612 [Ditylenchus destructor]|nr:hypothetical protein Ddc_13612 [Ditylenchus destructor]
MTSRKTEVKDSLNVREDVIEEARLFIKETANNAVQEAIGNLVCRDVLGKHYPASVWNFVCAYLHGVKKKETPNRVVTNVTPNRYLSIKSEGDRAFYYFFSLNG